MNINSKALLAAAGIATFAFSPANAYEGLFGNQSKPGGFIGASAGVPPPGIYMFDQVFTYQSTLSGPGAAAVHGASPNTGAQLAVDVQGFLFVPGWTFLGATYDAVVFQPFVQANVGQPINVSVAGMFNTGIINELSWKFGNFGVKTNIVVYVPDGTKTGVNGTGNVGSPFVTYQPGLILSYLGNGWNLSAAIYEEFNTTNTVDHYTSGDIFHADFTATKTIGKWTLGPVAYYFAQVSNDSCPVSCLAFNPTGTLGNAQRFQVWAVGGLVGYDFGPASLSVWATQEVSAKASNAAALAATGSDPSLIPQGATVFATLSYRLWAPEAPVQPAMYHK
jgi:hypothetical protein